MKKKIILAVALLGLGIALSIFLVGAPNRTGQAQDATPEIILYTGENFTGRSLRLQENLYDLPKAPEQDGSEFDWNDQIRSLVVVSGTWRIYQNGRCNTLLDGEAIEALDVRSKPPAIGWSTLVSATSTGQLQVSDLAAVGVGGDISSVELISAANLPDWTFAMRK